MKHGRFRPVLAWMEIILLIDPHFNGVAWAESISDRSIGRDRAGVGALAGALMPPLRSRPQELPRRSEL